MDSDFEYLPTEDTESDYSATTGELEPERPPAFHSDSSLDSERSAAGWGRRGGAPGPAEESRGSSSTGSGAPRAGDDDAMLSTDQEYVSTVEDDVVGGGHSPESRYSGDSYVSLANLRGPDAESNHSHSNQPTEDDETRDDNTPEYEPEDAAEHELPAVSIPEAEQASRGSDYSEAGASRPRERSPEGPPSKIRKTRSGTDVGERSDAEDDGGTCSICLDAWSTSGEHRLVALKCGHLFGRSCVVRWLKSQPLSERRCPACKARATQRDIRCIYARKLIAADTSEVDALRQALETARSEKIRVELELHKTQLQQRLYAQQLLDMRAVVADLRSRGGPERRAESGRLRWHFALEKSLEVAGDASCRVLAYNCRKYELYASQKSTANLFPGFGIRKIDCVNFKLGHFVYVHPKAIRDMRYSAVNDLLATVALDKTAKLISGNNGHVTTTIKTEMPLWSCCWDRVQPTKLLVGGPGGVTLLYDTRNPTAPVERWTVPSDVSPIVSLASTPEGFLSCHLNSCWFYKRTGSEYSPSMLPIDGPFLSLSYEEHSRHILVSCRPTSAGCKTARHVIAHLDFADDAAEWRTLHSFAGSSVQTLMSRPCQMRLGGDDWFAAHNESAGAVAVYSANRFRLAQSLATQDPVVDMCALDFSGNHFLATLSTSKARIYKANGTS